MESNIFAPRKTPIKPGQTRVYYGGAGYKHECIIKEVYEKHVLIEINGELLPMPTHTIGEEIK